MIHIWILLTQAVVWTCAKDKLPVVNNKVHKANVSPNCRYPEYIIDKEWWYASNPAGNKFPDINFLMSFSNTREGIGTRHLSFSNISLGIASCLAMTRYNRTQYTVIEFESGKQHCEQLVNGGPIVFIRTDAISHSRSETTRNRPSAADHCVHDLRSVQTWRAIALLSSISDPNNRFPDAYANPLPKGTYQVKVFEKPNRVRCDSDSSSTAVITESGIKFNLCLELNTYKKPYQSEMKVVSYIDSSKTGIPGAVGIYIVLATEIGGKVALFCGRYDINGDSIHLSLNAKSPYITECWTDKSSTYSGDGFLAFKLMLISAIPGPLGEESQLPMMPQDIIAPKPSINPITATIPQVQGSRNTTITPSNVTQNISIVTGSGATPASSPEITTSPTIVPSTTIVQERSASTDPLTTSTAPETTSTTAKTTALAPKSTPEAQISTSENLEDTSVDQSVTSTSPQVPESSESIIITEIPTESDAHSTIKVSTSESLTTEAAEESRIKKCKYPSGMVGRQYLLNSGLENGVTRTVSFQARYDFFSRIDMTQPAIQPPTELECVAMEYLGGDSFIYVHRYRNITYCGQYLYSSNAVLIREAPVANSNSNAGSLRSFVPNRSDPENASVDKGIKKRRSLEERSYEMITAVCPRYIQNIQSYTALIALDGFASTQAYFPDQGCFDTEAKFQVSFTSSSGESGCHNDETSRVYMKDGTMHIDTCGVGANFENPHHTDLRCLATWEGHDLDPYSLHQRYFLGVAKDREGNYNFYCMVGYWDQYDTYHLYLDTRNPRQTECLLNYRSSQSAGSFMIFNLSPRPLNWVETTAPGCDEGDCPPVTGCVGEGCDGEVPDCQGEDCPVPSCDVSGCQNDGECFMNPMSRKFTCLCPDRFYGDFCENEDPVDPYDPCMNNRCRNGASCIPSDENVVEINLADQTQSLYGYQCACADGYQGDFCQDDIDECETLPCLPDGQCMNSMGSYRCLCPGGFDNTNCGEPGDDPCIPGETCVPEPSDGLRSTMILVIFIILGLLVAVMIITTLAVKCRKQRKEDEFGSLASLTLPVADYIPNFSSARFNSIGTWSEREAINDNPLSRPFVTKINI